jgi:hypothetical protein
MAGFRLDSFRGRLGLTESDRRRYYREPNGGSGAWNG